MFFLVLLEIDTCEFVVAAVSKIPQKCLILLFFLLCSVQIKEPAEMMTMPHESSATFRGHQNIGIHPEERGYGMHDYLSLI